MPSASKRPRSRRAMTGRPKKTTAPTGSELAALLNLGPKSSVWLAETGITTRAELERLGTIEVCRQLHLAGHPVSVVMAYAIEGALMGCHWNALPWEFKIHLRTEFAKMKRGLNSPRR